MPVLSTQLLFINQFKELNQLYTTNYFWKAKP